MYLVVGLGNPGPKYEQTRHNLGFKVIDDLVRRFDIPSLKSKCNSFIAETNYQGHKVILAQPQTFMNNSGLAVRGLLEWFKIKPASLVLIYDDVDLEVGQLRLREKGNAGGHHGVESVINSVGTTQFARIRLGIGRESVTGDVSDYVLARIPKDQEESLAEAVVLAADAVEAVMADGLTKAMNKFNQ